MPRPYPIASGIYAIRHAASGKLYIGSAVNITKRWNDHRRELANGTHHSPYLQNAWNRHGADAFVWEVLLSVDDRCALIGLEQEYLDAFRPYDRDFGYNVCPTAGSPLGRPFSEEARARMIGVKKGPLTPEHRQKVVAALAGRVFSPEHRAKLSEARRKRVHSPETRAKMSEAAKRRAATPEGHAALVEISNKWRNVG